MFFIFGCSLVESKRQGYFRFARYLLDLRLQYFICKGLLEWIKLLPLAREETNWTGLIFKCKKSLYSIVIQTFFECDAMNKMYNAIGMYDKTNCDGLMNYQWWQWFFPLGLIQSFASSFISSTKWYLIFAWR